VTNLLIALLLAATPVKVEDPWTRATPPGARIAAGYMKITSGGTADRLVGASSPAAAKVELHVTEKKGDVMRMREVKGYDIPAKGSFELAPGGAHLMLVDLKAPLKEGAKVPLVLRFEKAGEMKVELQVRALGASGHQMQMQH
jgi:copper(I)-binding protein